MITLQVTLALNERWTQNFFHLREEQEHLNPNPFTFKISKRSFLNMSKIILEITKDYTISLVNLMQLIHKIPVLNSFPSYYEPF